MTCQEPLNEPVLDPAVASDAVASVLGEEGASIIAGLKEKGWQPRKEALESLGTWLEEVRSIKLFIVIMSICFLQHPNSAASSMEAFSIHLKSCANNFKETNFNVNKAVMETARKLCLAAGNAFSKPCAVVFLKGYCDKVNALQPLIYLVCLSLSILSQIADSKIGPPYKTLVDVYATQFSPRFALAVILSIIPNVTNPKAGHI